MNEQSSTLFRTTRWTRVLASVGESVEAKDALRDLCEVYYRPVEAFVRRYRTGNDDARDLTHEFFAKLLDGNSIRGVQASQGLFRTYLLGAVKHFLSDHFDRVLAAKRGGGQTPQSLDQLSNENSLNGTGHFVQEAIDPHGFPPDAFFDREWAVSIVELAIKTLATEWENRGDKENFETLKRWLMPSRADEKTSEVADSLGMTDGAFKVAVHRLRKRFRQLVKDQIALGLDGPESLQEELNYLIQALMTPDASPVSSSP